MRLLAAAVWLFPPFEPRLAIQRTCFSPGRYGVYMSDAEAVVLYVCSSSRLWKLRRRSKGKAAEGAKGAANTRIIANEISVQPVGLEAEAKNIASNLDDAIEKNYKAALISSRLDKQHISFKAKNGALTLMGSVQNANERQQAQKLAAGIPNVQQVVNQIEVRR